MIIIIIIILKCTSSIVLEQFEFFPAFHYLNYSVCVCITHRKKVACPIHGCKQEKEIILMTIKIYIKPNVGRRLTTRIEMNDYVQTKWHPLYK